MAIDPITQSWIRNSSDQKAAEAGCIFDLERAEYVVGWIESHCRLWEGTDRGPMILADWQREATMRLFGWVKWSDRLKRWIRRFTRANIWIPKKNGKTPTAAAWALYLLAGDGEQGQHVFFAAADKAQAAIAANHAIQMVDASPELSEEIIVNRSEKRLAHLPTNSDAKPISSADKKIAQAKQGLNGSVIVDELHVVSRSFISESSLDMAGISRDEPLFVAVSTAGKDPDEYGHAQYEHGKAVEAGTVTDQGFFFLCYEAPQGVSDEEIAADPLKYGRMANPTMGRIVQEEEFLAHHARALAGGLADYADFKTFRLNIWQRAASPWIRASDWAACRAAYTLDDLAGMTCATGLDLAKTRDMTALVLAFPWGDGGVRLWPLFFLPEQGLKRLAVKVPQVLEWHAAGHIILTPGDVTDYRFVRQQVDELVAAVVIELIVFDPYGAEQLTQEISSDLGIERRKFFQTMAYYNEPTQELERLILSRKLEHPGNPVLDWQMGHVKVQTDVNANKRPVKPALSDHKKIDGAVAAIMAVAGAKLGGGEYEGWYSPGGLRD